MGLKVEFRMGWSRMRDMAREYTCSGNAVWSQWGFSGKVGIDGVRGVDGVDGNKDAEFRTGGGEVLHAVAMRFSAVGF